MGGKAKKVVKNVGKAVTRTTKKAVKKVSSKVLPDKAEKVVEKARKAVSAAARAPIKTTQNIAAGVEDLVKGDKKGVTDRAKAVKSDLKKTGDKVTDAVKYPVKVVQSKILPDKVEKGIEKGRKIVSAAVRTPLKVGGEIAAGVDDLRRGDLKGVKDRASNVEDIVKDRLAATEDLVKGDFKGVGDRLGVNKPKPVKRSNDDPYKRHVGLKKAETQERSKRRGSRAIARRFKTIFGRYF